jgi:hypothetical protein
MNWIGLLFIVAGLFSIAGAVLNWGLFWNSWRTRIMIRLLSEPGTRIFYVLLGIALVVLGILFFTGSITA